MDDRRAWRLLPATHPAVPALLVSAAFGPAAYAVHVTDLVHVWTEQLDRRALCMRAFAENTAIDPSYDGEQMGVFLGKLAAALEGGETTSLALGVEGDDDLVLHIEATLPQGLPPLRWPMRLRRQPAGAVAAALVLPLVRAQARRRRERAALVAALRDKDAAIARLADKLEALGAGVDSAFPSLMAGGGHRPSSSGAGSTAKRRWTRADVEQRVRGLAPFREGVLGDDDNDDDDDDDNEADVRQLVQDVFGTGPPLRSSAAAQAALAPEVARLDGWWRGLAGSSGGGQGLELAPVVQGRDGAAKDASSKTKTTGTMTDDDAQGDDAFQTTTPTTTTPQRPGRSQAEDTEGTAASPTPAKTAVPTRPKAGLGKIGRLGAIGAKAKAAAVQPEAAKHELPDDDETASEAEDGPAERKEDTVTENTPAAETVREKAAAASPQGTPSPARRPAKGGLGKIGGKAKKEVEIAPKEAEKAPAADTRSTVLQQAVAKHAAPVRKKRKF